MAAARIQRWALLLRGYQYKLEYRKGSENVNANILSRLPLPAREPENSQMELPEYVLYLLTLEQAPVRAQELVHLTQKDTLLQHIAKWIVKGWPMCLAETEEWFRPFFHKLDELTKSQGMIYWGHRVEAPKAAALRFLETLHETHPGMATMKSLARSIFWYPGIEADIENFVRHCETCSQASACSPTTSTPAGAKTKMVSAACRLCRASTGAHSSGACGCKN